MYGLGLKVIHCLCREQSALGWNKAKLSARLFQKDEQPAFEWVADFVQTHHALPKIETLVEAFPDIKNIETLEPSSYYIKKLEDKYFYDLLSSTNTGVYETLKSDQAAHDVAVAKMQEAINEIMAQKYRARLMDFGKEGPAEVLKAYHKLLKTEDPAEFGWPHMDKLGGVMPGEVVSYVGRPAMGKTFFVLNGALHNWREGRNVLFVSMEMAPLPIAQRAAAMYAHTNLTQLKLGAYATYPTGNSLYEKFGKALQLIGKEKAKMYIVDGNLAASAEDVYTLADQLECPIVMIDGAYLLRHKNTRLDRFNRAAENTELIKRYSSDLDMSTFASWQFGRGAVKKGKNKGEDAGLEDIGYTDTIGQISSIVLGLFQEEGVETMKQRTIKVLKGRDGQVGQFSVKWDFMNMDFSQTQGSGDASELQFV